MSLIAAASAVSAARMVAVIQRSTPRAAGI